MEFRSVNDFSYLYVCVCVCVCVVSKLWAADSCFFVIIRWFVQSVQTGAKVS